MPELSSIKKETVLNWYKHGTKKKDMCDYFLIYEHHPLTKTYLTYSTPMHNALKQLLLCELNVKNNA